MTTRGQPTRYILAVGLGLLLGLAALETLVGIFSAVNYHRDLFLHKASANLARQRLNNKSLSTQPIYNFTEGAKVLPPDPILGYRLADNIIAYDNMGVYVMTGQGFSSTDNADHFYSKIKPANTFRVIIFGGSTVFGTGSHVPAESLPAQLAELIKKHNLKTNIEVINAGVPGYYSSEEVLYYMAELIGYRPDLVIFYDGANDFYYPNRQIAAERDEWLPYYTSAHRRLKKRLDDSYTFSGSLRLLLEMIPSSLGFVDEFIFFHVTHTPLPQPPISYDARTMAAYEENLELAIYLSQRGHIRVALFLQPVLGVAGGEIPRALKGFIDNQASLRSYYADARRVFARLKSRFETPGKVGVADLSVDFLNHEDVFVDNVHLNASGNGRMATEMFSYLVRDHLLSAAYGGLQ